MLSSHPCLETTMVSALGVISHPSFVSSRIGTCCLYLEEARVSENVRKLTRTVGFVKVHELAFFPLLITEGAGLPQRDNELDAHAFIPKYSFSLSETFSIGHLSVCR